MKVSLILACAGSGSRAGFNKNKMLVKIGGVPLINKTLNGFISSGLIDEFIVTASEKDFEQIKSLLPEGVVLVKGGDTRTQSITNALDKVTGDVVLIHDGARPFINDKIIKDCIENAVKFGSAIPVIPSANTVCLAQDGIIEEYIGKDKVYSIQTPQGFHAERIKKAYALIGDKTFNDDGEIYKRFIGELHTYNGSAENIKLTYPEDFEKLNFVPDCRVGTGFDCHKLVENRSLILGGITIPHTKGLLGHSDADVLTHAVMDAMLSAVCERDIGFHFPDTDSKYKGAFSIDLLKEVINICKNKGYKVKSVSAVIMAEKPKLLKHIPTITENLASVLGIDKNCLGIGATTLEGLGFVGREEGICVSATAVMERI